MNTVLVRKRGAIGMVLAGLALSAGRTPIASGASGSESPYLNLSTGQPAAFVIGQPRLDAAEAGPTFMKRGWGNASILEGRLFIADTAGNRIWMFHAVPRATRVAPDAVLGAASLADPASAPFTWPLDIQAYNGKYYVTDNRARLVSIWNEPPVGKRDYADATLVTGFGYLEGLTIADGKMVTSSWNGDVRIWRSVPTGGTAADGSPVILSSAGGVPFKAAGKHWTDGRKLLIADYGNNRVLGWNTLPTLNDQVPDFVLGQSAIDCSGSCDPGTTRERLRGPYGVASNGIQIFVRDRDNNRVMVWNAFPTRNGAPADVVLGQADFESGACNRGLAGDGHASAATLCLGSGIFYGDHKLFVADEPTKAAARWLVFESK